MPGKPVRIGPFTDGLNNVSLSGESKDTELVEMVNFEVGPDNLLWSRPPFEIAEGTTIDGDTVSSTWKVLGIYRTSTTEWYVLVVKPKTDGGGEVRAYLSGDFTGSFILVKSFSSGNKVTAFVQMNADCYFCVSPSSSIDSFKWSKDTTVVSVPAMKKGNAMIAFQSRLWIAGIDTAAQNSRLYFSAIGVGGPTPDVWNSVDFADIAPGEGGFITALLALNSSIMIFKNDGTWRFSYPSSPSKGQVVKLSGSVGTATATSVVEFENYVYVYDQGRLYELVNSTFTQLNRFVRFDKDTFGVDSAADGVDLSVVNRRLIVRYFNNIYAYSIDSRSWSQWRSYKGVPSKLYEMPADSASTSSSVYVAASAGTAQAPGVDVIPVFTHNYAMVLDSRVGDGNSVSLDESDDLTVTTAVTSSLLFADKLMLASGQKWQLTGKLTMHGGSLEARLVCLLKNGTFTTITRVLSTGDINETYSVPSNTVSASITFVHIATDDTDSYVLEWLKFKRLDGASPVTIMLVKDEYGTGPIMLEHIECKIRTKSYDFQAPSVAKRLFWWGADIKSNQYVTTRLIPNAIRRVPSWKQLGGYTHNQLKAGTWGNPLSFLYNSLEVVDGGDPRNAVTENGRIFIKLIKSIRFKQVSFELETSTLGNQATGPCKVHTLTAYVMPKEKVVDKFN